MSDAPVRRGGRPKGLSNIKTRLFTAIVRDTPGEDLETRLAAIAENPAIDLDMRLESLRHIFAFYCVRVSRQVLPAQPSSP
jgi:hypothetical protein